MTPGARDGNAVIERSRVPGDVQPLARHERLYHNLRKITDGKPGASSPKDAFFAGFAFAGPGIPFFGSAGPGFSASGGRCAKETAAGADVCGRPGLVSPGDEAAIDRRDAGVGGFSGSRFFAGSAFLVAGAGWLTAFRSAAFPLRTAAFRGFSREGALSFAGRVRAV